MKTIEIISNSPEETKKAGRGLASFFKKEKSPRRGAAVIAFEGGLGAGKTTFTQGLAEGLGVKKDVLSPTFVILKEFPLRLENFKKFYHIDAYRTENPEEILELGFEDLIKNPENIIAVEWAEKIEKILPQKAVRIRFENLGKEKRKILIYS